MLRLSQTALGDTPPGQIVNLLSNDVSRFDLVGKFLNALWTGPLLLCIVIVFLWHEIRYAGMVGIAIIFIVVPIQSKLCDKINQKWGVFSMDEKFYLGFFFLTCRNFI